MTAPFDPGAAGATVEEVQRFEQWVRDEAHRLEVAWYDAPKEERQLHLLFSAVLSLTQLNAQMLARIEALEQRGG